jgi:hypothetical protein
MAPRHRLTRLCQRETGQVVQSGPFAGMTCLHDAVSGGYVPKLLGTYERELHPIISGLCDLGITRILNIGAADGYYSVGLCRVLPDASAIAFETHPRGREFIQAMAEQNGVAPRIGIRGTCNPSELRAAMRDAVNTLVFCDVEGYEDVLLDPVSVPELRDAWLLVEIHDNKNPGVSQRIHDRFQQSHTINVIWQSPRTPADFPFCNCYTLSLSPEHLAIAVDEGRPVRHGTKPMSWFWMSPRSDRTTNDKSSVPGFEQDRACSDGRDITKVIK